MTPEVRGEAMRLALNMVDKSAERRGKTLSAEKRQALAEHAIAEFPLIAEVAERNISALHTIDLGDD